MTKEEFNEVFKSAFSERSFRKIGLVYHKGNDEVQIFVNKQRSYYDAAYYINYRVYLCGPEDVKQHIKDDGRTDLRAGLSFEKEGKIYYSLVLDAFDVQQAASAIRTGAALLDSFLDNNTLREFLLSNPKYHVIMSPRLKQWVGISK